MNARTDGQLLALAAKAGCIDTSKPWAPLADDGDALRLAISLRIDVEFHWREGSVSAMNYEMCAEFNMQGASERLDPDDAAATRRAIVRAAAQFGERMQ